MATIRQARSLGIEHGHANMAPFGSPGDLDESALMTALGVTTPTTKRNQPHRIRLIDAYVTGWEDARAVNAMCRKEES